MYKAICELCGEDSDLKLTTVFTALAAAVIAQDVRPFAKLC